MHVYLDRKRGFNLNTYDKAEDLKCYCDGYVPEIIKKIYMIDILYDFSIQNDSFSKLFRKKKGEYA